MSESASKLRLALLISGGGTTMREIIRSTRDDRLPGIEPALVIASRPDASGLDKAAALRIPERDLIVLERKTFMSLDAFGASILAECRRRSIDLIGQYGWLPLTPRNVIEAYAGRIISQHPGPLDPGRPDFGGKGMYGRRVHCARLLFVRQTTRDYTTTVVAHHVTAEFDRGTVIHSATIPILDDDDPITLQQRALPFEHQVQIETLQFFANRGVPSSQRAEPLVRDAEVGCLEESKRIAGLLFPKG